MEVYLECPHDGTKMSCSFSRRREGKKLLQLHLILVPKAFYKMLAVSPNLSQKEPGKKTTLSHQIFMALICYNRNRSKLTYFYYDTIT